MIETDSEASRDFDFNFFNGASFNTHTFYPPSVQLIVGNGGDAHNRSEQLARTSLWYAACNLFKEKGAHTLLVSYAYHKLLMQF